MIREPEVLHGREHCGRDKDCFHLKIPMNYTMLQAYNCDRQKPGQKTEQMPAEKQFYRPSYVKLHFIHYSTVTELSEMNREEHDKYWKGKREFKLTHGVFPDPLSRFGDEVNEGTLVSSCRLFCGGSETSCLLTSASSVGLCCENSRFDDS